MDTGVGSRSGIAPDDVAGDLQVDHAVRVLALKQPMHRRVQRFRGGGPHALARHAVPRVDRFDVAGDRLREGLGWGGVPAALAEQAALGEFAHEVVGALVTWCFGRVAAAQVVQLAAPRPRRFRLPDDRQHAARGQAVAEARQDDIPLHPVEAAGRGGERVGRRERRVFHARLDPPDVRVVAAGQCPSRPQHGAGEVDRVHLLHLGRQHARHRPRAAAGVQHHARLIDDQRAQDVEHARGNGRPVGIRGDDALFRELGRVVGAHVRRL